jgi:hypothetical protein
VPAPSTYDFAISRVVPRVERDEFLNAGAIAFCRTQRYLEAAIDLDVRRLAVLAPHIDPEEVQRHLATITLICRGGPDAGPIGALSPAERFHWLVAPRSTVIQTSPVHCGLCDDPAAALARLMVTMVRLP